MITFSLQVRYGKRWGPLHPNVTYDKDRESEFFFRYGEYISKLNIYSGAKAVAGFDFETNLQSHSIIGRRTKRLLSIQGQRMLFISGSTNEALDRPVINQIRIYFDAC